MTDLDRSMRRIRVALFLFGVPFALSVAGLGFRSALSDVFAIRPELVEMAAAATAVALLSAILAGWSVDRRALLTQERELLERSHSLTLRTHELESAQARHALELKLREQALDKEISVREERVRIRELEYALRLREGAGDREELRATTDEDLDEEAASPRREPPATLTRQRRTFHELDSVEPSAVPTNQE